MLSWIFYQFSQLPTPQKSKLKVSLYETPIYTTNSQNMMSTFHLFVFFIVVPLSATVEVIVLVLHDLKKKKKEYNKKKKKEFNVLKTFCFPLSQF